MTADFRALCAELADALNGHTSLYEGHESELVARARAALAQPEPVVPTDEELLKTYCDARRAFYFEAAEGESDQEDRKAATIAGLRAILARYARPAIEPVPVSERLPGEGDCDAEGRCWLHGPHLLGHEATWVYGYPAWAQRFTAVYSHWLPCHALPVPQQESDR